MVVKHETNDNDQGAYIFGKVWEIARLLKHIHQLKNAKIQLNDLMTGDQFEFLIDAAKSMPKEGPSVLKRIGETLGKISVVQKAHLIATKAGKKERKDAEDFNGV